jgi:ComF family protein
MSSETPTAVKPPTSPSGDERVGSIVARWRRRMWLAMVNLVVPPGCALCGKDVDFADGEPLLCDTCRGLLAPRAWLSCRRCGMLVDEPTIAAPRAADDPSVPADGCPRCRNRPYHFDGAAPLGPYRDELRRAVLRMKNRTGDHLATALGDLYADRRGEELVPFKADVVVPIPMHWLRYVFRGTNSPEIMAARISRRLGVPFESAMLVRHRKTRPQAELSPTKRFENVRGAFRLGRRYDIKGARVLLVDDIMTTGATCSEAAKVLKKSGAEAVFAAVAARTIESNR